MSKKHWIGLTLAVAVGCGVAPVTDREKTLMSMASEEAKLIVDPRDRLSRQLNFAYDQTGDHQPAEARASLAHAVETLKSAEAAKMDWQIRIAGWVSVSELSRGLKDTAVADAACDQAVALLHQIDPVADRPQYAFGVAAEVKALHGPGPSAAVLVESSEWTKQIKDEHTRRKALYMTADRIFDCDDYKGGLIALRTDPDAAWRSDMMKRLADGPASRFQPLVVDQNGVTNDSRYLDANGNLVVPKNLKANRSLDWIGNAGNSAVPGSTAASSGNSPAGDPSMADAPYEKPVDFQSVFRNSVPRR